MPGRRGKKGRSNSYEKKKVGGPFIADIFTKELKTGKLPFKQNEERIARYGKGFSNLLTMAGNTNSNLNFQYINFIEKRYTRFCMIFFNSNRYSCIQFPLEKNRRSWYGAQVCEMTLIQGIFYMFTLKILCAFACKGNMGKPDHEKMESASEIQNVRW